MRRQGMVFGFMIILLFISGVNFTFAVPTWLPLLGDTAPAGTPPTVAVETWTTDTTVLNINIHGFWVDEYTFGPVIYKKIYLPAEEDALTSYGAGNHGYVMEPGKSQLPVIRTFLGVISDATTVTTILLQELSPPIYMSSFTIYPYQQAVGIGDTIPPFHRDDIHYVSTQWYPFDPDSPPYSEMQYSVGMWHHCPVSEVNIYPFFAQPGMNQIRVLKQFRMAFTHSGTPRLDVYNCSKTWWDAYNNHIANFGNISHVFPGPIQPQKPLLLVYTPHDFQSSSVFKDFVRWKKRKGVSVTVKDSDTFSTDSEKLKTDIKNFYDAHVCFDIYILLLGDRSLIHPSWYSYMKGGSGTVVDSDFLFTRVNGNDDYGDVFIGRIPAKNVSEMEVMLNKTLTYETNPPGGNWPYKSLFCAHYDNTSHMYPDYKDKVANATYNPGALSVTKVYGNNAGVSDTSIINGINNHVGYVNYNGHGTWNSWYQWHQLGGPSYESFYSSNIDSLTTGTYTPIVFSTACYNSQCLTTGGDCISKVWVKKQDKGAVASIGSDNVYWTYPGHEWDRVLFCKIFGTTDHTPVKILGPLVAFSHMSAMVYWNEHHGNGDKDLASINTIQTFIYGDPNLTLRTCESHNFSIISETTDLPPDHAQITFHVGWEPWMGFYMIVQGASVVIEDNSTGEILGTQYTDAGGSASFTVAKGKTILTTIFAQNFYPYQTTVFFPSRVNDWKLIR